MSHGAAAVSCCVRVIGTCVTCVACAGRATMTRRGGGGRGGGRGGHRKLCRGTCRDMGKLPETRTAVYALCSRPCHELWTDELVLCYFVCVVDEPAALKLDWAFQVGHTLTSPTAAYERYLSSIFTIVTLSSRMDFTT